MRQDSTQCGGARFRYPVLGVDLVDPMITEEDDIIIQAEPRRYKYRGHAYMSVTGVIDAAGLGPDFNCVPKHVLKAACDRGNKVHQACSYYNDFDLDWNSIAPQIRGYVEAYMKFKMECPITVLANEKRMVCEDLGLAGTPDIICFLRGRRSVIDIKSSQSVHYSARLQTAGYQILWGCLNPKQPVYERYALRLGRDGNYKLQAHEDSGDIGRFMAAFNYVRSNKN